MKALTSKKDIKKINGMLTSLNRFILRFAQHALSFFNFLKKQTKFEWNAEYDKMFESMKKTLANFE